MSYAKCARLLLILQRFGTKIFSVITRSLRNNFERSTDIFRTLMSHQSDLFFFDQCFRRRTYKRYRKPQELLPFSLRLTGLSGAVKVEAYLKQQQKAAESKDGQHVKSFTTDKDNNEASETSPRKDGDFAVAEGGKKLQAGQTFNLPEISTRGISSLPVIRNFEQLEGDDEEEDTQRFLFEENKFAAPNLLAQLGRLISQLHEQQLEELDEIRSSSGQFYNRSATPPLDREQQSLYSDTIRRGGVVISLPDDLYKRLRGNFEELSASAVYVHREWQTTSYKEQAILLKRLEMMNDSQVALGQSKSHEKTDQNKSHEDKLSSVRNTETNSKEHSLRKVSIVDATAKADSASDLRREVALGVNTPTTDTGGHAEIPSRQESAKPAFAPNRPNKTRIERLKGYSEKLLSGECLPTSYSFIFLHGNFNLIMNRTRRSKCVKFTLIVTGNEVKSRCRFHKVLMASFSRADARN